MSEPRGSLIGLKRPLAEVKKPTPAEDVEREFIGSTAETRVVETAPRKYVQPYVQPYVGTVVQQPPKERQYTTPVTFRMPMKLHKKLLEVAAARGITMTDIMIDGSKIVLSQLGVDLSFLDS